MAAKLSVAKQLEQAAESEPDVEFSVEEIDYSSHYVLTHAHPTLGAISACFNFRGHPEVLYRFNGGTINIRVHRGMERDMTKATIVKQLAGTLRRPIKVLAKGLSDASDHLRESDNELARIRSRVRGLTAAIGLVQ